VHLALGGAVLDIIDPAFTDAEFAKGVSESFLAAGVAERVKLYAGASPGAVHALVQKFGLTWSLMFIDGDHEGDAPRLDAEAAMQYAANTAMVLFHDLASPYVAAGLDVLRNAGWQTMVYQTMQIMGVAWRGNVKPVAHIPDPKIFWTLPRHLSGYAVSGWERPNVNSGNAASMEDQRNAAMLRAQAAEDEYIKIQFEKAAALRTAKFLETSLITARKERDAATATARAMETALMAMKREG
jgi:hypothetical protein